MTEVHKITEEMSCPMAEQNNIRRLFIYLFYGYNYEDMEGVIQQRNMVWNLMGDIA